ncbi:hypothetical protein [Legionella cardiaca]|uniref:Dot/Icm T4SS effector n=1 Tax=Legionella cardiaca TaxID=1071983 RepID=A0ABY8ATR4_9GAMM|nr:hypothetical protein [Legionella cardiaca]WED44072.1 hypothetical protein PXX05_04600 [Legionella cardiaca]
MKLSKKSYLQRKNPQPYRLNVEDYPLILPYYFAKYQINNISFVVNGSTELGQAMMARNQLELQAEFDEYKNKELVYAMQVIRDWVPPNVKMPGKYKLNQKNTRYSDFQRYYPELYKAIKDQFLDQNGRFKELTLEEKHQLNSIVKKLKCRKKLDQYQNEIVADLAERKSKVCLTKIQAVAEIKAIQRTLNPNETVAYFFTNNRRKGSAHFEVLLISRNRVIKPVHWHLHEDNILDEVHLPDMFHTDLSPFVSFEFNQASSEELHDDPIKRVQPQADLDSCGILGLLYFKELLKANAEQLNEFSLNIPLYVDADNRVKKNCLFFPSPQVLRYSQSKLYNQIIKAMLEGTQDVVSIRYKNITYKVKTLESILRYSIQSSREKADVETAKHNEELLANLPSFRQRWLEEYKNAAAKRQRMQGQPNNLYLSYKGRRIEEILHDIKTDNKKSEKRAIPSVNKEEESNKLHPRKKSKQVHPSLNEKAMCEANKTQSSGLHSCATVAKESYNPIYESLSSKPRVVFYKMMSFFKPQGQALVAYNPLYKSLNEKENDEPLHCEIS